MQKYTSESHPRYGSPICVSNARGPVTNAQLSKIHPFDLLPPHALEQAEAEARVVRGDKGFIFFEEGECSDHVFVLITGRVRVAHFRADGSVRTLCMFGPGETFCCLPALDGGAYPATGIAAVPSDVFRFSGAAFRKLTEENVEFGRAVLHQFCGRLRENSCESCTGPDDAPTRLAAKLLGMRAKFGDEIPLTRREMGELAGTTVETAIRVLKEFERRGWLTLGRGKIQVLDAGSLEAKTRGDGVEPTDSIALRELPVSIEPGRRSDTG